MVAEGALGESGALGDLAAQVDGEAAPEGSGVGVPEDGGFVVVGVRVERSAEFGGVVVVDGCRSGSGRRSGRLWTGPKQGAVKVAKTRGWCGDVVRGALAAAESGGDQVEGVAAVGLGAGGAAGGAAVVAADEEVAGGQGGRRSRWCRTGRSRRLWCRGCVRCGGRRGGWGGCSRRGRRAGGAVAGMVPRAARVPSSGSGGGVVRVMMGSPSRLGSWRGWAAGAADAWRYRGRPGSSLGQRRWRGGVSSERRTTAQTATETAVTATATRSAVRTTPTVTTAATAPAPTPRVRSGRGEPAVMGGRAGRAAGRERAGARRWRVDVAAVWSGACGYLGSGTRRTSLSYSSRCVCR